MKALTELIEDKSLDKVERILVSKLVRDIIVSTETGVDTRASVKPRVKAVSESLHDLADKLE